jgi:hypothetical protein
MVEKLINIASIHRNYRSWGEIQLLSHIHLMRLASTNTGPARQITLMLEHQVQLYRTLGTPDLCPVEYRQAKINRRFINTYQWILEPKICFCFAANELASDNRL